MPDIAAELFLPVRDRRREVILLADHDVSRRVAVERWLVPHGFIVRIVVQGDNLAAAVDQHLPDVLILSSAFQRENVCDTLRSIGNIASHAGTCIIVLGEREAYEQRIRVLEAGAFSVLKPPPAMEELSALLQAYQRMKTHLRRAATTQRNGGGDGAAFLEEFHAILSASYHDPGLTLHSFARRAPWKAEHISRRILVLSGLPFRRYVLRYRLSMARDRLENAECSVAEVARQCGFNHASYFSNAFRKEFGMLPKKLQMSVQRNQRKRHAGTDREALSHRG